MLSPDNMYRDIVEGLFNEDQPQHHNRARLRAQAKETLAAEVDPLAQKAAKRRPGGQPGNKNRLTHGRRSRAVQHAKRIARDLTESFTAADPTLGGDGWSLPTPYKQALRWSNADRACLEIAVLKKAELLRWRLAVLDALDAHENPPDPPAIMFTPREIGLYKIFIEQQRILGGSIAS
jgi:hypothetical protein